MAKSTRAPPVQEGFSGLCAAFSMSFKGFMALQTSVHRLRKSITLTILPFPSWILQQVNS
jgi:hypothetical protein